MGTDQATADAVYLLGRIERLGGDEVSERDMFTAASRGRFKTTEDLRPALERLVDHGYLVPLPKPKPTGGRPNPRATRWSQKPRKQQKVHHDRLLFACFAASATAGQESTNAGDD